MTIADFKNLLTETVFDQKVNNYGFLKASLTDFEKNYPDNSSIVDESLIGVRFTRLDEHTIVYRCEWTDMIGDWRIQEDIDNAESVDYFIFDAFLEL